MLAMTSYIDLTMPTEWSDITLGQFQELERLEDKEDIISVLGILTEKTRDEIMGYPSEILDRLMQCLDFMQEAPVYTVTNEIEIDGETYSINTKEKLKVGEYLNADAALKNDPTDYASLLAIVCRKDDEVYDTDFEANKFNDRREMYLKAPITKVLPLTAFFLQRLELLGMTTAAYSMVEEYINSTVELIESSQRDGRLGKRTMRQWMKTLSRYRGAINSMRQNT